MERILEGLWNPLLGGFVLCAGLLLMLGTGMLPLRRLGRMARGSKLSTPSGPAILFAASASLTTITAAVLAVTVAGPGALVWMWIAAALGMALHFGEAKLARGAVRAGRAAMPGWATAGLLAVALLAGGLWQGSQSGVLLEATFALPAVFGAAAIAVIALVATRVPMATALAVRWLPLLGLAAFTVVAGAVIAQDPLAVQLSLGDAINEAFGLQSATAGTVGGALSALIAQGMMRAVSAADLGIGAAAAAVTVDADEGLDPDDAGASVMWIPLVVVGVLSTLAALVIMGGGPEAPLADPHLQPLERPTSRGLRPSKDVGQTIVLPASTTMKKGEQYAMLLRADPRGHKIAKLLDKENAVILPSWAIAGDVDTVVFRARSPQRADQAAWDVAVPCNRELFGGQGEAPTFVRLTPKDPELDFKKFAAFYELDPAPYVVVSDAHFVGAVAMANSPDEALGEHLAMFEYRGPDAAFNPRLHEFFRNQFRGPYPDPAQPQDTPPLAFIADPMLDDAKVGDRIDLELRPDPRGIDILRVNRVGQIEAPPWHSLMDLHEVVLRHAEDPAKDVFIPVAARLDGKRIRLDALDPKWKDFRPVANDDAFTGPYAVLPAVAFEAEVHTDTRLPPAAKGRRSLVPIHDDVLPRGPQERALYAPHPAELIAAGFSAPFHTRADPRALVRRVEDGVPRWGGPVLGVAILLLAASTTIGWSLLIREPARRLLGESGAVLVPLGVCIMPALGGLVAASITASLAMLAYALAAVPVLALLVLRLSDVRRSSRS